MQIPETVGQIIRKLQEHGLEAYAVGGCVRDCLLGRVPEDWDITTSASPKQVKEIFRRTIDTGIRHGTVTVMCENEGYEVTTYRIDGEYLDGRHPKEVFFTAELVEDLRRRDFTINAMAYSEETGIVDAFSGQHDLEQGIIRCVGEPMERFSEDALRILRAIRFSAQLGFTIEPATWQAVMQNAPNIARVSKERIQMELTKLLLSDRPEQIKQVYMAGISSYISPAFAAVPWQQIRISSELPHDKFLRWAAFLHVVSAAEAVVILKDLKLDNDTIKKVKILVEWSLAEIAPEQAAVRRVMSQMEPEVWQALLDLKESLTDSDTIGSLRVLAGEILAAGDCLGLQHLAVKGQDLIDAGMRPGRPVGEALQFLLDQVLEVPQDNKKDTLLTLAKTAFQFQKS